MNITIKNLTKRYGKKVALDSISLEIGEGMFGLLGPNGAGKTTLMRILATLLGKSCGEVTVNGKSIQDKRYVRGIVGYLPQDFSMYPRLTVFETMDYFALLSKIKSAKVRKDLIGELLEKVNLQEERKTSIKALSGGMKRRLGIAQALINDPQLLIADEPTAGLDPEERIRFRNLLVHFSKGRTVLLSTHIVSDIESTCENIAILKLGKIAYKGKVGNLIGQTQGNIWQLDVDRDEWQNNRESFCINDTDIISNVSEGSRFKIKILSPAKPAQNAQMVEPTIEDSYMNLIREAN
jgi:ABC-2 type transport system ATP-binding protein